MLSIIASIFSAILLTETSTPLQRLVDDEELFKEITERGSINNDILEWTGISPTSISYGTRIKTMMECMRRWPDSVEGKSHLIASCLNSLQ